MSKYLSPRLDSLLDWLRAHGFERAEKHFRAFLDSLDRWPSWLAWVLASAVGMAAVLLIAAYWPFLLAAVAGGAAHRFLSGK